MAELVGARNVLIGIYLEKYLISTWAKLLPTAQYTWVQPL